MTETNKLIKRFKGIAIFAIIWNIIGVAFFFMHTTISDESLGDLPENVQAIYNNIPLWKNIAYAVAVFGGLIGSVLLFLRKKLAVPILTLSLIGIIISFYYDFFATKLIDIYGNGAIAMPLIIFIIGIFLAWYSKKLNGFKFLN